MRQLRARDVMTGPAITVHPETTIPELVRRMLDHRISGLPVTDHLGRIVGIASVTDLAAHEEAARTGSDRPSGNEGVRRPIVGDLMTRDVVTADEDTSVRTLASLMARNGVNRIPITTDRRVLGVVTRADLVRAFAEGDVEPCHTSVGVDGTTRSEDHIRADTARVLLVTDRRSVEGAVGDRLEDVGFDVLLCPGPRPPDYVCIGGAGGRCPLVHDADVVVLDCDLGSDAVHLGTTSWDLLCHYRRAGLPVVALALADGDGLPPEASDPGVVVLPKTTDPASVAGAVARALAASGEPSRARTSHESTETP